MRRAPSAYPAPSMLHRRALGDLVDDLLFGAQRDADDLGIFGCEFGEDGAVGGVVAGREHFLDEKRSGNIALQRAAMDGRHHRLVGGEHDDRLDR